MKQVKKKSTENCYFYSGEKSLYVAWACFRNVCSENKGADQLVGYREVDLRLCFRICEIPVFPERGSSMFKSK